MKKTLHIIITILVLWISISLVIQAFKCPKMSQTELLLHIPKSYILKFKTCN